MIGACASDSDFQNFEDEGPLVRKGIVLSAPSHVRGLRSLNERADEQVLRRSTPLSRSIVLPQP